jgi:hypothetical protein
MNDEEKRKPPRTAGEIAAEIRETLKKNKNVTVMVNTRLDMEAIVETLSYEESRRTYFRFRQ